MAQELYLRLGLDPFGNHPEAEILRQRYDGRSNGLVIDIGGDVLDEGTIDLQTTHGKPLQRTEA
ncbi:hypothetical protein D3C72_2439800 [compost metagenome]